MIYELRNYRCHPGKLDAVLQRFEGPTLAIWRRMDFRPVGFWTARSEDGADLLIYVVAWDSTAEREAKWAEFLGDPEWKAARTASEANGPLLASFTTTVLTPTSFSALQ